MAKYSIEDTTLSAVADGVRGLVTAGAMTPAGMAANLQSAAGEVSNQAGLIEQIVTALDGKVAGSGGSGNGGGGGDGSIKHVKFVARPASTTSFVITNPLGGIAKIISVERTVSSASSNRKIQTYIAASNANIGALYAVSSSGSANYAVAGVSSGVNNAQFMISDGSITLYRYNSSNTWDSANDYEVEIYE